MALHSSFDLVALFLEINEKYFDGFLDPPRLAWNARLRASAGRFIPGSRKFPTAFPPKIEIASYLQEEKNAEIFVRDTLSHEIIHYWLWVRQRPFGHSDEFLTKMREMGVKRYNPVPRVRAFKYLYHCKTCGKYFRAKTLLKGLACEDCCKLYSSGKFDSRFLLERRDVKA